MSTNNPQVIFYGYDQSPYCQKVKYMLALKHVPYKQVTLRTILPRPQIAGLLGIGYRRVPLLAIGNDVYCDSHLIATALERRFPPSPGGYATLYPARKGSDTGHADTGAFKFFAKGVSVLFPLVGQLLPWSKFPASFIKDREDFFGAPVDPKAIESKLNTTIATIQSWLTILEEQLADGRTWIFDTVTPSYADVSAFFVINWAYQNKQHRPAIFDEKLYHHVLKWMAAMNYALKHDQADHHAAKTNPISAEEAAHIIGTSRYESYNTVGFDTTTAQRLGVSEGAEVSVAPIDTGASHPTTGKLIGLNTEEIVLEIVTPSKSVIRCHFPKIGYSIRLAKAASKL